MVTLTEKSSFPFLWFATIGVAFALNFVGTESKALAQFRESVILPEGGPAVELGPARRLPRNQLSQAAYSQAAASISSGNVAEGLSTLQEVLDQESDFFVTESAAGPSSQFQRIEDLIRNHHEEYERLYGPTASQLLADARSKQNALQFEEIVRRYEMTAAGASALEELIPLARDNGDAARALNLIERLARHPAVKNKKSLLTRGIDLLQMAGDREQALAFMMRHSDVFKEESEKKDLLKRFTSPSVNSFGNAPFYEWRLPFGGVSQVGATQPAPAFTKSAWQAPLVDDTYDFWLLEAPGVAHRLGKDTKDLMAAMERRIRAQAGRIAFPAGRPLVVNNLVITSGPGSVKAFDAQGGELVWNGLIVDETFDYLAKWSYSAAESQDGTREEMRNLFAAVRGWRDLTSSSISSDGRRVYTVTGCQLVGTTSPQRMMQNTQRHPLLPQRSNRLIAYDLATEGKIAWPLNLHVSDSSTDAFGEPREIFFLGAPLPVEEHLYVLGEERGQVQLFELDPETGAILWSLGLLNPDRDLVLDDARRLAGLTPAYSNGLLICPTAEGTLVAVDPMKRQVVWTHFYASSTTSLQAQAFMMRVVRPQNQAASQAREELLGDQRWFDSRVMVSGSYVIFTPPDDDNLVCLNLLDGKPLFEKVVPRGQSVYAATVYEDDLLLVGRSELSMLNLSGGESGWKQAIPIPNPSGRGIRMGNQFLQPLQTGEIAVVDLPSGRLLTRMPVEGDLPPGNLISANGRLFIQSGTGVTALRSVEEMQQDIIQLLTKNANDENGLALRGAWELQQGRVDVGISDLKRSVDIGDGAMARSILIWSLLDGLRTDFAAFRAKAEELEPKLQDNEQRLQFLRTFAQGLQSTGEVSAAFKNYLKVLNLLAPSEIVHDIDSEWGATDSRWTLGRIEELLEKSEGELQKDLHQEFADWVKNVDPQILVRHLPSIPATWVPSQLVLDQLAKVKLKAELQQPFDATLRPMLESSDSKIRVQAAAQLLRLARETDDTRSLQEMLSILEKEPSVNLESSRQSSKELAVVTRQDPAVADRLHSVLEWKQPIHVGDPQAGGSRSSLTQIPRLGPPSRSLDGWTFFLDQAGGHIEIFDPQGRHRERIATGYPGVRYAVESDLARYVSMQDHIAVVVLLDRFLLIDFLNETQSPRLIVNRSLTSEGETVFTGRGPFSVPPRAGLRSSLIEIRQGQLSGNVGPLGRSLLCYNSGTNLIAIHPGTGAELWQRRDIAIGSEILGDDQYVVVKPPEVAALDVYRAVDGGFVIRRPLPMGTLTSLDRLSGDWGRFLPRVEDVDGNFQWSLYDPAANETVWKYSAPRGTVWSPVEGQDVAFISPERRLTLFDGLTGKVRFEATVPSDQKIEQFTLMRFPEQFVLLTATHRADAIRRQTFGVRAQDLVLAEVSGLVCAFSPDKGDVLWNKEIVGQNVVTQSPREWPVLLFARGRGRMESQILNRFTGEVVRRNTAPGDESGVSWLTETHPLRLHIKFGHDRATLFFGEAPPASSKPPHAPVQSESIR